MMHSSGISNRSWARLWPKLQPLEASSKLVTDTMQPFGIRGIVPLTV